jgi:SLT domain-containing protein
MRILTLAAGVAVGYVLGSRAGREKYEEIAATARKMSEHPTVVQAQEKAKELLNNGAQAAVVRRPLPRVSLRRGAWSARRRTRAGRPACGC